MPDLTPEQIRQAVAQGMRDGLRENSSSGAFSGGGTPTPGGKFTGPAVAGAVDKGIGTSAGLVEKAFSNTAPTLSGFSGQLADLTEKIGTEGLGKTVRSFGSTLDSNLQVFRTLSGTGIDLGESLMSAQLAAGKARLPLDVFGKTVQQNSQFLAVMGGSATEGAQKFASVSGLVMAGAGKELSRLGLTMDDIAEGTATYMETMQRSGLARRMDDAQLAAGAAEYNKELDRLAKATGVSRKALDEQNAAAARDLRMRNAMQALMEKDPTGKLAAQVQAEIARLKQADPSGKLAAGMVDSISAGGNAITKEAREYQLAMRRNGQDAARVTREVYEGNAGSVAALVKANDDAAASARERSKQDRNLVGVYTTMNTDNMITASARLGQLGDGSAALAKAQAEQEDKLKSQDPTRLVTNLDQTLTEVQNKFKSALIDSGILDNTAIGMNYAGDQAVELADSFDNLKTWAKVTALAGTGIAGEMMGLAAGGGLAAYGASKVYDKYQREKAGETLPPGAEGPTRPGKTPLKAAMATGKAVLKKTFKIGLITWALYEIADATGVREVIVEQGKEALLKPEDERGPTIAQRRAMDAAKLETAARRPLERPATPPPAPAVPARPATERTPTSTSEDATVRQRQATVNATADTRKQVEALNEAAKKSDLSSLVLPENVSVSLENGNNKLRELKTNIMSTSSAFSELNNINMDKLTQSLVQLNANMEKLTQQGTNPIDNKPKGAEQSSTAMSAPSDKEMLDILNQLNMNMGRMVSQQSDAVDYLSKTAKNTRNSVGNML
jgi:hypothetical protein